MSSFLNRLSLKFLLTVVGLFLIGSLPALFQGIHVNFLSYVRSLVSVLDQIIHPGTIEYMQKSGSYPLFPQIFEPWFRSMNVYFLSFCLAFLLALIVACLTMLLPRKIVKMIKSVIFVLESLPDVLIISLLIIGVIWIYQKMGILVANIASYGDENKVILLPVIVMTVLPAIMLYRTMILDFEEETKKPYYELAQSKGLSRQAILFVHIFRNAVIRIFLDSKYVLWFMLSNLLITEYIFNLYGLTNFMMDHPTPLIFTVGLFLLFVPIFVFLTVGQFIIEKVTAQEVDM